VPAWRIVLALFACLLVASCDEEEPSPRAIHTAARDTARPMTLESRLAAHIDSLAGAGGYRSRVAHTDGHRWSREYIRRAFAAAGVEARVDPVEGTELANVVATIEGRSDSIVVIGGHFDASASRDRGWKRGWRSMPAPGAVDNATGVAALIEIARLVRAQGRPRYTIELVAFDAEEFSPRHRGHHLGSRAYAARIRREHRRLRGAIILDMVVSKGSGRRVGLFATRRSRRLAEELVDLAVAHGGESRVALASAPCSRSDNESFDLLGLPAVLFMESCAPWRAGPDGRRRYAAYHSSADLPGQVEHAVLVDIVELIVEYLRVPALAGR
jgi:Zn-dependent M28 family amino/carboxypeptidase